MGCIRKNIKLKLLVFFIAAIYVNCDPGYYFERSVHDGDPLSVPSDVLAPPAVEYNEAVEKARLLARDLLSEDNLPGLSAAVAVDNKLVWAEGFGWADLKNRVPVTPSTQFRIGTTTKSLTAAAAGLLFERGLLDLDAVVQKYVPDFPKKQWDVTTRQLMAHISGIRHYGHEENILSIGKKHYHNVLESLDIFADYPLLFKPSTEYRYSSYGWILVGAIIQAAAGEPYFDFMEREIFKSLGMQNTVPDYANRVMPNRASFYWPFMATNTRLGIENATEADLSVLLPAAGYISTPVDLVQFGIAMLGGSLLKPKTVEMLQTVQELTSGETTESGFGWDVRSVSTGENSTSSLMISCPGTTVGGTTSFMIFPEHRMVIAVVSNVSFAEGVSPFAVKVAGLFSDTR
ncbi:serine hydrolase domain-containing protein [candidate division KSB1 bacterium]